MPTQTFQPLTPEQYQSARSAGFSADQIIQNEQTRKSSVPAAPAAPAAPAPDTSPWAQFQQNVTGKAPGAAPASYGTQVSNAFQSGVAQANEGAQAANASTGILGKAAGVLHFGAGLAGAVSAPVAPLFAPVGKAIDAAGKALAQTPYMQGYGRDTASLSDKEATPGILQPLADAGTIASTALGAKGLLEKAPTMAKTVKDTVSPPPPAGSLEAQPKLVQNRVAELTNIERNSAPVRKVTEKAKAQGIDPKLILSQTDLLHGAVDNTGTINTIPAMGELNDFIKPQESVISDALAREGVNIPLEKVRQAQTAAIDKSGLEGAALENAYTKLDAEMKGLSRRANSDGTIPLAKIQDAKVNKYSTVDYTNEGAKIADKALARTYKTLVEKHTKSADVHGLNAELQRHYSVMNLLEKLNGKKVEGGRLGKYFAKTVGGIVGSHFGPLGTIAGAELGGMMKGKSLSSTFKGKTGGQLTQPPEMQQAILNNQMPRLGLPAPKEGTPTKANYSPIPLRGKIVDEPQAPQSSMSAGSRNTSQSTTIAPTINTIPETLSQPPKEASPLSTPKSSSSDKPTTGLLDKAKQVFNDIKTKGNRGFIKLPKDTAKSVSPEAIAKKVGALDVFRIKDYLANHPDPALNVNAETKIGPVIKGMGIKHLDTTTQKRFLQEVVDTYEAQQGRDNRGRYTTK